jgi:hypothetical protein
VTRLLALSLFAVALAALPSLAAPPSAQAAPPPPPSDLRVYGGEEVWRPSRSFRILWRNPAADPPIAAVHYRVRDPRGSVVAGPVRVPWAASSAEDVLVPPIPGAYTAEVWLEDTRGLQGAPASAQLRFDDERPGGVTPSVGATWVGRTAFPLPVRLTPPGRVPISGLRGYAVSVSPDPERTPCAAADRCAPVETDLHGGAGDDTYAIDDMPEGTHHVRAVAVSGSGMASVVSDPLTLHVDETYPTTTLRGLPAGWSDGPVRLTATAADSGSGMAARAGGVQPFTAISIDGATPTTAMGASVAAAVLGEGVHRVAHYARDLAGNVNDGGTTNGIPNPPPREALVRIDSTPPTLSFVHAQDPSAPELIGAKVADSLSGPDPSRGWIGVRRRGSGDPFEPLPAAPAPAGELRARWSSDAYPDGEYEFRAVGFDRAGNRAATGLRTGGAEMVLSNPLKERVTLTAALDGPAEAGRTVGFGNRPVVGGQLVSGSRPLASMPVEIVERYADGATRTSQVVTAADGSFSVRLAAGPSREVNAVFAGNETLTRAASPVQRLAVRGEVRMTTSAKVAEVGGAPLIFAGRVSAAPGTIPAEGKAVELQFRLPGEPWTEFRTIRTDRRGRFRHRYRFSDDDSRGVRFLFRAYAPAQGDWPYEPTGSKPVAVRGR